MNKEKLTEFHKDSILKVADALFSKLGFEKTTIETIAKASEYSKPTIYAYFGSKEEIFAENLYRRMRAFGERLTKAVSAGESAYEAYLLCCFELAALKRTEPVWFNGVAGALDYRGAIPDSLTQKIRALSYTINATVKGLFDRAARDGSIRPPRDRDAAYAYLWSAAVGIASSPMLAPDRFRTKAEADEALARCFRSAIVCYLPEPDGSHSIKNDREE